MTKIQDIDYNVTTIEKEGGAIIMTLINKNIENKAPITDKPLLISIQINMMSPDTTGLPKPEEIKTIGDIEESIVNAFLKNDSVILAGWFKAKEQIHFLFYTADATGYENTLKEAMRVSPSYIYSSSIKEDVEWKEYFEMIEQSKNK